MARSFWGRGPWSQCAACFDLRRQQLARARAGDRRPKVGLPSDGLGLAPSRQRTRDVGPVDLFGLSWPLAVSLRRPPPTRVGVSWISLDSLVTIKTFQWVTSLEAGIIFPRAFCLALAATTGVCGRGHAEAQDCSCGKLHLISDFLQQIVAEPFPFGRLNPKANRPRWVLLPKRVNS
jgi:hypothetical protein